MESDDSSLIFFVNGRKVTVNNADPRLTLLQYLRNELQLTGTKSACGTGGCGACTVMVSRYDWNERKIRHCAVTACLVPLCSLHGCAIITVEGIGSTREKVHPVQERLALFHGTQCGFCSPGMVMSMYTLLRNNPKPTEEEIRRAIEGNLCRCTGYKPILEGFSTFAKDTCPLGEECCQQKKIKTPQTRTQKLGPSSVSPYDPSQELIFPSELQLKKALYQRSIEVTKDGVAWMQPASLPELLHLRTTYPEAQIVAGNTARGKIKVPGIFICLSSVAELQYVKLCDNKLEVGAGTSLRRLEEDFYSLKDTHVELDTMEALLHVIKQFGGQQTRNMATVGGSIMIRRSDLCTFLVAAGATCRVVHQGQSYKDIPVLDLLTSGFGNGYVLVAVTVPVPHKDVDVWYYKHSDRGTFDTTVINMAVWARITEDRKLISLRVVTGAGGVPVLMEEELKHLTNRIVNNALVEDFSKCLKLPPDVSAYKAALVTGIFFKWTTKINMKFDATEQPELIRGVLSGTHVWEAVSPDQPSEDAVGRDVPHSSALEHTTGEAVYIDDMPQYKGELHVALVTSSRAHARILNINSSAALAVPGVVGFLTHEDIPGSNVDNFFPPDPFFAADKVTCVGHLIGFVVAESREMAKLGSEMMKIDYEDIVPAIFTLEDAIAAESFLAPPTVHEMGDVDAEMREADHVLEGEIEIGPQEHFYMETHAALAVPGGEKREMVVYCGSHGTDLIQKTVADVLGVPKNRIVVKTKRVGGSFGGKETRGWLVILPASIAAMKYNRPARCVLDREEDMRLTGTSHGMIGKYKVGFMRDGRIHAASLAMYLNGGHTKNSSEWVAEAAAQLVTNAYTAPNMRVYSRACRTNLPSCTGFRGYGGPQAVFFYENVMADIAHFLGLPLDQVQKTNFHKDGERIVTGEIVKYCSLQSCWEKCLEKSNYKERLALVEEFNRENRYKKRGIASMPVRHCVGISQRFMNQAGALVQVYASDGSVLLSYGGVEMGQGLNVKMIQVAGRVLGIPCEKIHVSEASSNIVPNTYSTAASSGSDINGMAVKLACEKILQRLEPYKKAKPEGTWDQWIMAAYLDCVSLSATGQYTFPGIDYDWKTRRGNMCAYYTYGVGCSEVELDCLTGAHQVLRTDVVMDVGKSLNPAIDIGQIEGGFLQGYGRLMLEHIRYDDKGRLITKGPGSYKIPAAGNVPREFNVTLLKDGPDVGAVYSSKGIGEPPMLFSISVFHAVKMAVTAARRELQRHGHFRLDSPATAERILAACGDLLDTINEGCKKPS